jgi:hypothetical protein
VIISVNRAEKDGKELVTFRVKCVRTGKDSSYKSEMIQLLDEDEDEEEDTEEESLPGTPPDNEFDDLGAIDEQPTLVSMWKCEKCAKSSPASLKLCPVCKGRLRPPGLV